MKAEQEKSKVTSYNKCGRKLKLAESVIFFKVRRVWGKKGKEVVLQERIRFA